MNSRPLMLLRLDTSATEEIGSTPRGALSIFPVTGGSFEGKLRGKVHAGGGDWVTAKGDATFELDLRVTLETDDGYDPQKIRPRGNLRGFPCAGAGG